MRRHVEWELCGPLRALLPRESEERAREHFYPQFRDWARTYVTDGVFQLIAPQDRLIVHLLRADRFEDLMTVARNAKADAERGHVVDKGRVYWATPSSATPGRRSRTSASTPRTASPSTTNWPKRPGRATAMSSASAATHASSPWAPSSPQLN